MRPLIALCLLAACAQAEPPAPFGVTMVEETACAGQGGRIVVGPDGAFCALPGARP